MGYTHYWEAAPGTVADKEAFGHTLVDAKAIIEEAGRQGIVIVREYNEPGTDPELTEGHIWLNGEGEDGHETFVFDASPGPFTFCKTARKPYDAVVTAILLSAQLHFGDALGISSDGDWDDWKPGRTLYEVATGREPVEPRRL